MDIEIFVHGVPNGQSFWGQEEDRNYFGNFYGQSNSDKMKYLIQTRSSNGKIYCYYNYLIYQNVIGNDGREGSYFGLSVRFDAYCKDFMEIYKILDSVFTVHILNKILKVQNGKYKYVISDFVSASEIMGNIQEAIWQLLQSTLTNESICSLGTFVGGGGSLPTGNLYEITDNDVEAKVKQYGKIALSPYYPTVREKVMTQQYDSKLQSVKQQYEERYSADIEAKEQTNRSLNDHLASVQKECTKLQETIANRDQIIAQKDSAITNLENQIKQIGQTQKAIKNINLIKAPIIELANILGEQRAYGYETNIKQKEENFSAKRLIPLVNLAMLLVIFIMMVSLLFKVLPKENKSIDSFESLQDSISILNEENENLRNQLSILENDNNTTQDIANEVSETMGSTSNPSRNIFIDVQNYDEKKGHFCKIGEIYRATIKNISTDNGSKWNIKGGRIVGEANSNTITFVPSSDKVTLSYQNENGESISRPLIITQN